MTLLDFAMFLGSVSFFGGLLDVALVNWAEREAKREQRLGTSHAPE